VLVVAADDGVMRRRSRRSSTARAANVAIVVAVNKIDKYGADPDRVRAELLKQEVIPEELGGDTMFVNVSAHTGAGIDQLLESILLAGGSARPQGAAGRPAVGVVLESSIEKGRGAVATVLVKRGHAQGGRSDHRRAEFGRVRAMFDAAASRCRKQALDPGRRSRPVECPERGRRPAGGGDERKAREVALYRQGKFRDVRLASPRRRPRTCARRWPRLPARTSS